MVNGDYEAMSRRELRDAWYGKYGELWNLSVEPQIDLKNLRRNPYCGRAGLIGELIVMDNIVGFCLEHDIRGRDENGGLVAVAEN